jgi:acyl-homoserine lactone acylase PvdQ
MRRDSAGALKYYYWRTQLSEDSGETRKGEITRRIDALRASLGEANAEPTLTADQSRALLDAVGPAMRRMRKTHGTLEAVWGDKFRVGRGEVSWPVGGGHLRDIGMRTLRSVGYGPDREDGTRWGKSGQTSTQVVVLSTPPESWTYVPIGQSDRPDSPHYRDQAEQLFSQRRLKPTWWQPTDLVGHVESRTVLGQAPGSSLDAD